MLIIIAISVDPSSAHIDVSHCTILQRFPNDWYQVTPDSKALEKALQCNVAIFWFSAFVSAVTSVTRKRNFIVFLLTRTQGTENTQERFFCFVLSPRQCWLNYIICGKHRMFSITVSSLGLSSFKYLERILVIFVSSPATAVKALVWNNSTLLRKIDFNRNHSL